MADRVYLDWNATAPLRPEARAAMLEAMDVVGNPSSVHAEGRAAKAVIEKARGQVARLVGCEPSEVVFTSGATEANVAAVQSAYETTFVCSPLVHDSLWAPLSNLELMQDGAVYVLDASETKIAGTTMGAHANASVDGERIVVPLEGGGAFETGFALMLSGADGETGVTSDILAATQRFKATVVHLDATQVVGKGEMSGRLQPCSSIALSAHKLGGPKATGALVLRGHQANQVTPLIPGGGQEMGRRSGTENVIGIAGFGAAAEAAQRDLESGVWDRVEKLRNILEETLATASNETIFVGKEAQRLPNTSCFITPGWKGETQVMQMDLAGFAISAGSACSSGKVKESRVLRAMGFDEVEARSAVRVSLGPTTTEDEVRAFAEAWTQAHKRWKARAA